jgi:hypothetical protein
MLDDFSSSTPYLFAAIFVAAWVGISYLVAYAGGWAKLAELYPDQSNSFDGATFRFRSGTMRSAARYDNVLTIGANSRGLYLGVIFLFRAGHPPLFIPWNEIEVARDEGLVFSYVIFQFRRAGGVRLRVMRSLGDKVLEAARGAS